MNIKDVARIIEAYEDMRMGGEVKHMKQVYGLSGNHKSYLEEKHRRHIDFRPFNGYLDGIRRKRYASMILEHAERLAKMEEAEWQAFRSRDDEAWEAEIKHHERKEEAS